MRDINTNLKKKKKKFLDYSELKREKCPLKNMHDMIWTQYFFPSPKVK